MCSDGLTHLQHLIVFIVDGQRVAHVLLEEDVGFVIEIKGGSVAVFPQPDGPSNVRNSPS